MILVFQIHVRLKTSAFTSQQEQNIQRQEHLKKIINNQILGTKSGLQIRFIKAYTNMNPYQIRARIDDTGTLQFSICL